MAQDGYIIILLSGSLYGDVDTYSDLDEDICIIHTLVRFQISPLVATPADLENQNYTYLNAN